MLKRRLDPPRKAAVAVSVAVPLAAGVICVALRTDWLRRAGEWLAWMGGALVAGLRTLAAQIAAWPWAGIGYALLVMTATIAIVVFLGWTAFLVPNAIGMLWHWRLTSAEALRAMAVVTCGVGANVAAVLWCVWFGIHCFGSELMEVLAWEYLWIFLFAIVEPVFWLTLTICSHGRPYPFTSAARIVAPRQVASYERLLGSLDRFRKDHRAGKKTPFGGDDEYAIDLTTVESRRNEWIRDNLDDLDAYAEYHPLFAKALGEWRKSQAGTNTDVAEIGMHDLHAGNKEAIR